VVAEERRPSKRKNRKARRAHRSKVAKGLPWSGRCWCEHCNGKAWPHIYVYDAKVGQRKYGRPDDRPKTVVSYECFIESQPQYAEKPDPKRILPPHIDIPAYDGASGTTNSASTEGLDWLAGLHEFGVNVDIGECALPSAEDDDLELEVVRHASFVKYLARILPNDADAQRAREKRYWQLCGEFTGRRLHQWFYVEFPGWLTQQYHAKRGGK
jgi:hypothetical protein